jgi:predicted nucleic acid-binding Zn ribbon protein
MKKIERYACESCGTEYRTVAEAAECEARAAAAKKTRLEVGDIVFARAGFGWYDGDREWIANANKVDPQRRGNPGPIQKGKCPNGDGNCFGECCTFKFYYVVTHIDEDNFNNEARRLHRPRYHLMTKAMTGKQGYGSGYTFDDGHWKPTLAQGVPAAVRLASRALIGEKATTLL